MIYITLYHPRHKRHTLHFYFAKYPYLPILTCSQDDQYEHTGSGTNITNIPVSLSAPQHGHLSKPGDNPPKPGDVITALCDVITKPADLNTAHCFFFFTLYCRTSEWELSPHARISDSLYWFSDFPPQPSAVWQPRYQQSKIR